MRRFQYLADGHHVDDAGNLISCTYVDFRDAAERYPITALNKASAKRYAIPGCETIRISKPACFLGHGEGVVVGGDDGSAAGTNNATAPAGDQLELGGARVPAESSSTKATDAELLFGRNGWIYCASIAPETPAERAARERAMPPGYDAVSPIRRPRAFARALGSTAAEHAGPRGRTVLLRNTVDGEAFSTAHRSQTVYHGPVIYSDDPHRRLERASSDLELLLLLVFLKDAAHRVQREYRFVVWAEDEPVEDRLDLPVSAALLEAMRPPLRDSAAGGFVPASVEESSTVETVHEDGHPTSTLQVEALPAFITGDIRTVAPRRYDVEPLPSDLRETALVYAGVEALRGAVARSAARCRKDAAAAAWHAEPIVRFFCSTFGDGLAGLRVSEDGLIVITAEFAGVDVVEVGIAVGPDGMCACRITVGEVHLASTAADARSFLSILKSRLAEVGVRGSDAAGGG